MPRALVLCEFATLNGGERSLLAVLPHLQRAGWEFDFLAPPEGPLADALREQGIAVVGRHDDVENAIQNRHYDLAHANSLAMSLFLGSRAGAIGAATVGHLRDIVRLSAAKVAQLNGNARLLAVSEATSARYIAQGLASERTYVLYNGIDTNVFLPSPLAEEGPGVRGNPTTDLRTELKVPSNAKLIGLIGQIILRKGQDTAIAAAAPLLQEDPKLHMVLLGERHSEKPETVEYERKLHAIAAEAGVADRVHYLGTRDDVAKILPQFRLLLHMARQEPLGRVLLEAASCGVPVVATDVGGTREIFPRDEDDGALLVPVDDAAAARTAVQTILADDALARRIGNAGRARIVSAYSVEQSAAGLLRHYEEVRASVEP